MAHVRPTPILFRKLSNFSAQVPRYWAPSRRWSLSVTQTGAEDGQVQTQRTVKKKGPNPLAEIQFGLAVL